MVFEVYHDLVPVFVVMSLYMAVAGIHMIGWMARESSSAYHAGARYRLCGSAERAARSAVAEPMAGVRPHWIVRMVQRKDSPDDDDTDHHSFSNPQLAELIIRGGSSSWFLYGSCVFRV